jgi:mannonate dehydratase
MEQTWRWYGPHDPVTLADARQAGATGIVSALHHLPPGEVWSSEEISKRKQMIEAEGLRWSVVESVNISEDIKTRGSKWNQHIAAYRDTLRNLAAQGIYNVCYNFMPVLDWLRTHLAWKLDSNALTLRFNATAFAAFDLFILKRKAAEAEWPEERKKLALAYYNQMSEGERDELTRTVLAGLPGTTDVYTIEDINRRLDTYKDINADSLRQNYSEFLRAVCPVAEELGVRLGVHPDDPPRSLLGLPRIVSTADDLAFILAQSPERANGLTFCTGSLGVLPQNDLPAMAKRFAGRINFVHLRSTKREADPMSFHEATHLDGDFDMIAVARELVLEQRRRKEKGEGEIPFRPDHGQQILTDIGRNSAPGYPAIGRLKGLAELRGVFRTLETVI